MTSSTSPQLRIRAALASDVRGIQALREPSEGKVLLHHDLVGLFEKVQEFFETMPKLKKDITFTCGSCNEENEYSLEGLASFLS